MTGSEPPPSFSTGPRRPNRSKQGTEWARAVRRLGVLVSMGGKANCLCLRGIWETPKPRYREETKPVVKVAWDHFRATTIFVRLRVMSPYAVAPADPNSCDPSSASPRDRAGSPRLIRYRSVPASEIVCRLRLRHVPRRGGSALPAPPLSPLNGDHPSTRAHGWSGHRWVRQRMASWGGPHTSLAFRAASQGAAGERAEAAVARTVA